MVVFAHVLFQSCHGRGKVGEFCISRKILNSLPNVSEKSGNFILGWRLGSRKSFLIGKGNVVSKGMQLQSCGFMTGFIGKEFVFYSH